MRTGQTIQEMASQLTRLRESSKDLIVPTAKMEMNTTAEIEVDGVGIFQPTDWAHSQIGSYADIPKQYYDRIRSQSPQLLASNVNHGFQMAINRVLAKRKNDARMLRTVDGKARAFLSSRYRILDSYDLLEVVLPIFLENEFQVKSNQMTEKKMYIKATTPRIEGEVKVGHPVQYGLSISSSDVGCGSLQVSPFLEELRCTNGMTMEQSIRKFHLGKEQSDGDDARELLSDETKQKKDEAFWMEVRDIVHGTMREDIFERELNRLREAAGEEIRNPKMEKVVELTMKEVGISGDSIKDSILSHIANGADGRGYNKWGLANAFTHASQSVEDLAYEEATDLERAGGKVIELPKSKWQTIAG